MPIRKMISAFRHPQIQAKPHEFDGNAGKFAKCGRSTPPIRKMISAFSIPHKSRTCKTMPPISPGLSRIGKDRSALAQPAAGERCPPCRTAPPSPEKPSPPRRGSKAADRSFLQAAPLCHRSFSRFGERPHCGNFSAFRLPQSIGSVSKDAPRRHRSAVPGTAFRIRISCPLRHRRVMPSRASAPLPLSAAGPPLDSFSCAADRLPLRTMPDGRNRTLSRRTAGGRTPRSFGAYRFFLPLSFPGYFTKGIDAAGGACYNIRKKILRSGAAEFRLTEPRSSPMPDKAVSPQCGCRKAPPMPPFPDTGPDQEPSAAPRSLPRLPRHRGHRADRHPAPSRKIQPEKGRDCSFARQAPNGRRGLSERTKPTGRHSPPRRHPDGPQHGFFGKIHPRPAEYFKADHHRLLP